jgi:hypothetical protein
MLVTVREGAMGDWLSSRLASEELEFSSINIVFLDKHPFTIVSIVMAIVPSYVT